MGVILYEMIVYPLSKKVLKEKETFFSPYNYFKPIRNPHSNESYNKEYLKDVWSPYFKKLLLNVLKTAPTKRWNIEQIIAYLDKYLQTYSLKELAEIRQNALKAPFTEKDSEKATQAITQALSEMGVCFQLSKATSQELKDFSLIPRKNRICSLELDFSYNQNLDDVTFSKFMTSLYECQLMQALYINFNETQCSEKFTYALEKVLEKNRRLKVISLSFENC